MRVMLAATLTSHPSRPPGEGYGSTRGKQQQSYPSHKTSKQPEWLLFGQFRIYTIRKFRNAETMSSILALPRESARVYPVLHNS